MNLSQNAGASSTHSKRCRAVSTFQKLAKRLECVRLAGAFGSWSRCAVVKPWRLPAQGGHELLKFFFHFSRIRDGLRDDQAE